MSVTSTQFETYERVNVRIDSARSVLLNRSERLIRTSPMMEEGRVFVSIQSALQNDQDVSSFSVEQLHIFDKILDEIDSLKVQFRKDYVNIIRSEMTIIEYNEAKKEMKSQITNDQPELVILQEQDS